MPFKIDCFSVDYEKVAKKVAEKFVGVDRLTYLCTRKRRDSSVG